MKKEIKNMTADLIYNKQNKLNYVSQDIILLAQRGLCDQKLINSIIEYLNSINKKVKYLN